MTHTDDTQSLLNELLNTLQISHPEQGYVSTAPAARWEDGTIVGNGTLGALCFARPHDEEIVLSHESLFLPIYPRHDYFDLKSHLDDIRELILAGKGDEAMRKTVRLAKEKGYPVRELTDPFIGACQLNITMPDNRCDTYARTVDFRTAGALVAWQSGAGLFHRRAFASRVHDVIAIELASPDDCPLNASIALERIERDLDQALYDRAVKQTTCTADAHFIRFDVQLKSLADDQALKGYSVSMRVHVEGGNTRVHDETLSITDAGRILLLIDIHPRWANGPTDADAIRQKLNALGTDYDALLDAHTECHAGLFDRVSLELCDRSQEHVPTEQLQGESSQGDPNPALIQKAFDAGRFGTLCSTGQLPPALQGIWTGTWQPNWSGDFTLNGNVQSAIAAALPGNYAECMRATLDYLSGLMDDFRTNARELFGFRGIFVPWRSSTHGQCHYAGHRQKDGANAFPGMYWFAGTAWWAWFYYDYWLYTGDEAFFDSQLKPFYLEAAAFYEDYLCVERDGVLVLAPSYSPENRPTGAHFLQPNATMTVACLKQLFRTLIKIGDRIGADANRQASWRDILEKLPAYRVDPSGALAEWAWPGVLNNERHRHVSHLYPLYDGVAPEIESNPALREACRVAIEKRLEYRRPKNGAEMAFGLTQLGMSASYLRDADLAYECVEWLANSYWSPAMVSQHDPGDILNLDISGGLPAIVMNMLVQSFEPEAPGSPYRISILPCLPKAWPQGTISGIRCRGGFEVALAWAESRVTRLKITSAHGAPCRVEFDGRSESPDIKRGECWHPTSL